MSTHPTRGIPLRPDYDLARRRDGDAALTSIARAALAQAHSTYTGEPPASILRRHFRADVGAAQIIERAAVPPASFGDPAWAGTLGRSTIADLLEALVEVSAGADLLSRALPLSFNGAASILLPLIGPPQPAPFLKAGSPVPIRQFQVGTSPPTLSPRWIPAITALTREQAESSNATTLLTDTLSRSLGLGIDSALFDATAGSDIRPAGLRFGINATVASTATTAETACLGDVAALVDATATVAGNSSPVFVCAPGRAMRLQRYLYGVDPAPTVLRSVTIGANDLLAIVPRAIAWAGDEVPEVVTSREATVHEADPASAIVNGGAAAPVINVFQSDTLAIKAKVQCVWARRSDAAVAYVSGISAW